MSRIRQPHNEGLRDALASQYALGTLKGAARRRFEKLMESDPELRIRVQEWSHRLSPMSHGLEPVEPPASVWNNILRQIRSEQKSASRFKQRFWENLVFWRGFSMATAALLVVITSVQWLLPGSPIVQVAKHEQMMVIVNDNKERPAWIIETSAKSNMMMVKTLHDVKMANGMGCALWLTWDDGMTMNLGMLPEKSGMMEMKKPPMPGRTLHNAKVVVSLEPMKQYDKKNIRGTLLFKDKFVTI